MRTRMALGAQNRAIAHGAGAAFTPGPNVMVLEKLGVPLATNKAFNHSQGREALCLIVQRPLDSLAELPSPWSIITATVTDHNLVLALESVKPALRAKEPWVAQAHRKAPA